MSYGQLIYISHMTVSSVNCEYGTVGQTRFFSLGEATSLGEGKL